MRIKKCIEIRGAEQNNLKKIDVDIPLHTFTVICGPSGSGKSSLAFETLFAEGQRRYTETLSNYARQYIKEAAKPLVESVKNVPPPILLSQRNNVRSSRSTVGTHSEILDHLRIIFSKVGVVQCPKHKTSLKQYSSSQGALEISKKFDRGYLLCPVEKISKKNREFFRRQMITEGFNRIAVIKKNKIDVQQLSDVQQLPSSLFYVVVDRLNFSDTSRVSDSLSQCYRASLQYNPHFHAGQALLFDLKGVSFFLNEKPACPVCLFEFPLFLTPSLFNFNSPLGACSACRGFGNTLTVDIDKVVPDPHLTIAEGCIHVFSTPATAFERRKLHAFCRERRIDTHTPWHQLSKKQREAIWKGDKSFFGIKGFFDFLETQKYKMHVRIFLSRYKTAVLCSECKGNRLREETKWILFQEKNVDQWSRMTLSDLKQNLNSLKLSSSEKALVKEPLKALIRKVQFINDIGLDYLQLDRPIRTLSGGELQRLNLSGQLGIGFSEILYILDEPTIGLHAYDCHRLMLIIKQLRTLGNTVVVIEHDPEVIQTAEHIIEMGPHSGFRGGEVIYNGSKSSFFKNKKSLTVQALSDRQMGPHREIDLKKFKYFLKLKGCHLNNLKNIDVQIPLSRLTVCTGVSGSGKSSLITDTLYSVVHSTLNKKSVSLKDYFLTQIEGCEKLQRVVLVDQSSAEQHSRSLICTYIGIYTFIRELMATASNSYPKSFKARDFSLNVEGGRCPECKGLGYQEIEMVFMDPVRLTCDTCKGLKFQSSVLGIRFRNKNIHQILQMTVHQAMEFFTAYPSVFSHLSILNKVGLGYLTLGQSLSTLSGGESQRLKLARELSSSKIKGTLYIFDEPSTGLHFKEVDLLIQVLNQLVDQRATVVLVEHNLQLISHCDYVIDLGPFAGKKGGFLVEQNPLPKFIKSKKGVTARCLREFLNL